MGKGKRTLYGCLIKDAGSFFDAMDKDQDGICDMLEVRTGLQKSGVVLSSASLGALLQSLGPHSMVDRTWFCHVLKSKLREGERVLPLTLKQSQNVMEWPPEEDNLNSSASGWSHESSSAVRFSSEISVETHLHQSSDVPLARRMVELGLTDEADDFESWCMSLAKDITKIADRYVCRGASSDNPQQA